MTEQAVIVVGGGPAGMMAALAAAETGLREVLLMEKNDSLGRKLLLTGNGRCNLTNDRSLQDLVAGVPGNGSFLYGAFSRYGPEDLRRFFARQGLPTKVEPDGRVFPASDRAVDVLKVLRGALTGAGVRIRTGTAVTDLIIQDGRAAGVTADDVRIPGGAVIVATGGISYPATGSTGDGYRWAATAGHRIVPTFPSLIPLIAAAPIPADLSGISLRETRAVLIDKDGRKVAEAAGEALFTHYGLSGPCILRLSRAAAPLLARGESLHLSLDLRPAQSPDELAGEINTILTREGRSLPANALAGFLPKALLKAAAVAAGVPVDVPSRQLTPAERERYCRILKDFRLSIKGTRPTAEAVVTNGGVATDEVDPRTMMSRLVPGLYFAGEVLDVDGYTGGYNLQAAFSTGRLAGMAAAKA